MEETLTTFLFRQLRYDIFLTLDTMMYVERSKALEFMFGVNKEGRSFLCQHYISIKNGFINEGLIEYGLGCNYNDYEQLERLYF
jgi:hypothetical protein